MILFTTLLLIGPILALPSDKDVQPYDLEDEIMKQIEQLRGIVRGEITAASNKIDNLIRDIYTIREECLLEAVVGIAQSYQTLNQELITIKDLAIGHDISTCLRVNEPLFHELPNAINSSLVECRAFANTELTVIMNNALYYIGTQINDVHVFEFQVQLCKGDLLCMEPLVKQIELAKISIPQKIGVEVLKAAELYDDLKLLIKKCTDDKIAQFNTEGGIIIAEITKCVNDILS